MKKTLLLFTVFLTITLVNAQGSASGADGESFTVGNYTFTITSAANDEAEVSGSTDTALNVPGIAVDAFDAVTYTITAVGSGAFKQNTAITSVILPASVKELKLDAFISATSLTSINLENVQIFNKNCLRLTGLITLGDLSSAVVLGDNGLGRANIMDIELALPALETLDRYAFVKANGAQNNLQVIRFGASLQTIGDNPIFYGLGALVSLEFASATPVTITDSANFVAGGMSIANVTLYVPSGATQDYIDAGWVGFKNIVEGSAPTLSTNNLEQELGLSLYPNPTNGVVNVKNSSNTNVAITVYDLNGRALLNKKVTNTTSEINITNLASGVYLFKVKSENGEFVKRILKQ
ncbi:T9SS type A sorting domain-containing protein [Algibacter sp. L1A34]|uniref:T9SS type A sorting domain-containing protein n=1 Tax=Algibacter sp. L1A34 TaxID=2686365 RepID=UPI00131C09E6|nr:T9SS type A sorting domain-containing protein [Algibacter sp. L1A34]